MKNWTFISVRRVRSGPHAGNWYAIAWGKSKPHRNQYMIKRALSPMQATDYYTNRKRAIGALLP